MKQTNDQQKASDNPNVVSIVDTTSAFDEIWCAFVEIFGEPTSPARSLLAKIVRELVARDATAEDVFHHASAMAAEWSVRCVTPASLWKHWGRFDGAISSIDDGDIERQKTAERYRRLAGEGGERS